MPSDRPKTTRRRFLATSALVFGAGCSADAENGSTPTPPGTTSTTGTPTTSAPTATKTQSTPDDTATPDTPEATEEPADRTTEQPAAVTPPYQGEYLQTGTVAENFESLDTWDAINGGEITADTETKFAGSQSMRVEGTGRAVIVGDFTDDPLDLSESDLSIAANFDEPSGETPAFQVIAQAPDSSNLQLFQRFVEPGKDIEWQRYDLAPTSERGDPQLDEVEKLMISVVPSDGATVSFNVDDIRLHPKPDRAKLVFRFDDTHPVHHESYLPVLNEHGYAGIEAVVKSMVGGKLTSGQLRDMRDAGWDLCYHTVEHRDITSMSKRELQENIDTMDTFFDELGAPEGKDLGVYTYGSYDGPSMDVMADNLDLVFGGGGLTNYNLTNPMNVAGFDAERGIEETKSMIDSAVKHRSLLVLMFHKKYSKAEFEQIVDYVAAQKDDIDVVTGTDLLDNLQLQ